MSFLNVYNCLVSCSVVNNAENMIDSLISLFEELYLSPKVII